MVDLLLVAASVLCAVFAIRSQRLLITAVWLAATSALLSLFFYTLGAVQVAVIELSVGAGLITVLFVFAIGVVGDEALAARPIMPRALAWGIVILAVAGLAALMLPWSGVRPAGPQMTFSQALWEERALDVLVQVVLIFAGVLGVLGLLTEAPEPSPRRAAAAPGRGETPAPGVQL